MPQGGYQKPKNPAPVSGPGKFSRRTDGQAVNPDIDNPDLQYGDRSMLEEANTAAPVRGAQGASVPRRMTGESMLGGSLPPWFTQTPDTNPDQPTTAGLDMGPGPGSEALQASKPSDDVREVVLQYLASQYGNRDAVAMLSKLRAERAASAQTPMVSAPTLGDGMPSAQPQVQPQQP